MVYIQIEDLTQRSSLLDKKQEADWRNIYVGLDAKERDTRRRGWAIVSNTDESLKG